MGDQPRALSGGRLNVGQVFRIGDTVRRPRREGSDVVEALLVHLEAVGFEAAPRFRGVDERGRQVLEYIDGEVFDEPPWQLDDHANAGRLGQLAALLKKLHDATAGFSPSIGQPQRPLPLPGSVWTHGDPGYPNVVYQEGRPAVLIDWEFAAPADPLCDPAALLGLYTRLPKPDVADNARRERALKLAVNSIADGYGASDDQRMALPNAAAAVIDNAADFWSARPDRPDEAVIARMRWRSAWLREHADAIAA